MIDIFRSCAKIQEICKDCAEVKQVVVLSRERGMVKTLKSRFLQAAFRVAREDRDGCSRYRASKLPALQVN